MVAGQFGKEKILAVIPARGGSKRLPDKNIMDFNGKPMISWTIEAALESEVFSDVLVSTDSNQIAEISLKHGAQVPFLREIAADDFSPVSLATLHALEQMELKTANQYSTVVQLMANCPLRGSKSIRDQITFFNNNQRSSVLSGFSYGFANPWWAHKVDIDGNAISLFPDLIKGQRSQDLPHLLCPSGATWVSDGEGLKKFKTFYSPGYLLYELSWIEAMDIDDMDDLKFAKAASQYSIDSKKNQ